MLKKNSLWPIFSGGLVLLALVLSFPGWFGLSKTVRIVGVQSPDGFVLTAEMPPGMAGERKRDFLFPDSPVLYENGRALARPWSSYKQITSAGRGRYQISGSNIHFSTSDGEPPAAREYTIRAPMWSLRESLLLAIWLVAVAAAAVAIRMALPDGAGSFAQCRCVAYAAPGLALALVAIFFWRATSFSDQFFLGLTIPAIWAAAMGLLATQKHFAGRAGLVVLAVLPAFAGWFYYGFNAASDSSFLVGGVIPCSDAWLHFLQAAEIAVHGTTKVLFNGRFFYPAFYSVILDVVGLNILVANLVVSLLVMLGLAFTCRLVAKRLGFAGAAVYCLLFWLYFRVHGCGLVMTENLGLLLGTLGFGFLLLSVGRENILSIYLAILFFGLGSVVRPGALFILPALALYAGFRVWIERPGRMRMASSATAVVLGLALTAGCFGANRLVMKSLSVGEGKAFQNFAFTLSGLLNDTTWSTSADASGWDAALVMEQNIKQIKESPASLVRGVGRAYGETMKKGFLFRFGPEKRLASSGMTMFILASLGCWLWKPLRRDAGWIILVVAAIIASIPFAPPWDAGVRPYAASVPVQIFLAAAGFAMLIDLFRRLAEAVVTGAPAGFLREIPDGDLTAGDATFNTAPGLILLSALCFFLVFPAPLILKLSGFRHPVPSEAPASLPGSRVLVSQEGPSHFGCITRANFLDRLSNFQASYPKEAKFFSSQPADFLLAVNWSSLQTVLLPWPDGATGAALPLPER